MSDLIRTDDIIDYIIENEISDINISSLKAVFRSVPSYKVDTSYDLESVIERLENINSVDYGSMFSYEAHSAVKECMKDVIEIVKFGTTVTNGKN